MAETQGNPPCSDRRHDRVDGCVYNVTGCPVDDDSVKAVIVAFCDLLI